MPLFSPIYSSTRPYSQTKSNTQRDLMQPDEVLRLDNSRCIVLFQGHHCKLVRVNGNGGRVVDLNDFRERAVRRADMTSIKVYESAEDLKDATVISRSGSEIQVLHPDNYSTVDLRVPEGAEIGDSVKVVTIDDVLYMVP